MGLVCLIAVSLQQQQQVLACGPDLFRLLQFQQYPYQQQPYQQQPFQQNPNQFQQIPNQQIPNQQIPNQQFPNQQQYQPNVLPNNQLGWASKWAARAQFPVCHLIKHLNRALNTFVANKLAFLNK